VIEPWLLHAIVTAVATYTRPGHRVLLLAPPRSTGTGTRPAHPHTDYDADPLTGLIEAAGTASRLGRSIEARTAGADHHAPGPDEPPLVRPESVQQLVPRSARPGRSAHRPGPPHGGPAAVGPDSFDLVIATVDAHHSDWATGTDWGRLLAPCGVLAFITQSDRRWGRLVDSTGRLIRTAGCCGLDLFDRVVLLRVPIRNGALDAGPVLPGLLPTDVTGGRAPRPARVHADLLLFTRPQEEI
jgi:hypothetical protein